MRATVFLFLLVVACGADETSVAPPVCGPNAAPQGAECVCDTGFVADTTPQDGCRPQIVCRTQGGTAGQFNLELPPLAEGREQTCAVYIGGKVYIVGGSAGEGMNNVRSRSVEVLDLATKLMAPGPPLPEARDGHACFASQGKLVVAGGRSRSDSYSRSVFIFDPATQTWTKGPMLHDARAWAGHAQDPAGSRLFLVGGRTNSPPQADIYLDSVEAAEGGMAWESLEPIPQRAFIYTAVWNEGKLMVLGGATFYDKVVYYDNVWEWSPGNRAGSSWVHHEEQVPVVPSSTVAATDRAGNGWVLVGGTFNRLAPPPVWLEPQDSIPPADEGCNPYVSSSEPGMAYSPPDHAFIVAGGRCNNGLTSRRLVAYCPL